MRNLASILARAGEGPLILPGLERDYTTGATSFFDLLINAFCKELRVLESYGLIREYERQISERGDFRGKLLARETVFRNWAKGVYTRGWLEHHEFTRDVPLNRALRYTIWHLLRTYPSIAATFNPEVMRDLDRAADAFASLPLDQSRSFLPALRLALRPGGLGPGRDYLRKLLVISLMVLDDLGVDFDKLIRPDITLPPLVVNMERVFQEFITRELTRCVSRKGTMEIWDTTKSHKVPLLSAPAVLPPSTFPITTSTAELAEPDFVVARSGKPIIVGDIKYKVERQRPDLYQVISHALAYGVSHAVLIYPDTVSGDAVSADCLGDIGEVRLFVLRFPLASDDLLGAADQLEMRIGEIAEQLHFAPEASVA